MSDNQMSDLAKAVSAGERIPSTTDTIQYGDSLVNGMNIPKGAVAITEGAQSLLSTPENHPVPKGGKLFTFSKDDEPNGDNNK